MSGQQILLSDASLIITLFAFSITLLQLFQSSDGQGNVMCFKSYKGEGRCRRPMKNSAADSESCCSRNLATGYAEFKDKDRRLGYRCSSCSSLAKKDKTVTQKPIDGGWTNWSDWSECSMSCGNDSVRRRMRSCTNPPPQFNGNSCGDDWVQNENCKMPNCPVDGSWGDWSKFGECSVSCSKGVRTRIRKCNNPTTAFGGRPCEGRDSYSVECILPPCPIDGQWSSWNSWSDCTATCDIGIRQRWRLCNNPPPKHGGLRCPGKRAQIKNCTAPMRCPINGEWSRWSEWSSCYSDKCGSGFGIVVGQRSCNKPRPQFKGQMCQGLFIRDATCTDPINCAILGEWSSWSSWKCIADSIIQRTRTCIFEADSSGVRQKQPCQGEDTETKLPSDSKVAAAQVKQFCKSTKNEDVLWEENGSGSGSGFGSGSGSGSGSGEGDQED